MSAVWGATKSWTSHFNAADSSTDAPSGVNGSTTGVVFADRSKSSPEKAASLRPSPASSKICRSRGVVYGELEPVPNDPSVDPDWDLCFNCWKPTHSHKECKYPKYHDYCRNCGRRGVNWTTCPRCAKGYREYQQWRLDNNRPEYKERVKPIVPRQVVQNTSKDVPPAPLVELSASTAPMENKFKVAQADSTIKSIAASKAAFEDGNTISQSRFTASDSSSMSRTLFGHEFKMAASEFPLMKSIPVSTASVQNEYTFAQPGLNSVSSSFPTHTSTFENKYMTVQSQYETSNAAYGNKYKIVQPGFNSVSSSFPTRTSTFENKYMTVQSEYETSNAAYGNEYEIAQSGYPVSKFFPTSRPFGNESMTFHTANSFPTFESKKENANVEIGESATYSENLMRQDGVSKPILPPPLRNAARDMNINTVTHSRPNSAMYQHAIREIIMQNERANQSIDSKQNKPNSLGESLISSEEEDYIIDEDLDEIVVDEEETDSTEPSASNTVQDFLSLIDVVKHLPIETQNKIVEQFAKERRVLSY